MATAHTSERTMTREAAAALLQELTDGVTAGMLVVGQDEESRTIDIPEAVLVELEFESKEGDVSVEVELEWEEKGDRSGEAAAAIEDLAEVADAAKSAEESKELPLAPAEGTESLAHFEVFRDQADEWRWRLVHQNGNIIADSGEGYTRKHNALKGLRSVRRNCPGANVVDVTQ